MARTTIACARCRKLKVKCNHDGRPPCRGCVKKGRVANGECILSLPALASGRLSNATSSPQKNQIASRRNATTGATPGTPSSTALGGSAVEGDRRLLSTGSDALTVIRIFCRKFPELRFVHESTLLAALPSSKSRATTQHQQLLFATLRVLCLPLIETPGQGMTSEDRAKEIRDRIPLADPPTVPLVQALLVLSMYEWAAGNGYRAWMYCGIAIRMVQSLALLPSVKKLTGVEAQVYNRTTWGCFIMDRLVFCGKPQPFMLPVTSLSTSWPVSEEDFAFGEPVTAERRVISERGLLEGMGTDMNHFYDILVRGFDIWARILRWVVRGGRRLSGMCLPQNHPWVTDSPWRRLYDELQAWRAHQDRRLHYVPGSPKLHASLGQGEAFGYINLIYYVSLIFLEREYMPFLPTPESEPCGPADQPMLTIPPPEGWWHDRAAELFSASANIPLLLAELQDVDAAMMTPFVGFSAFSAATMNLYVSAYPNMNLKRSAESSIDVLITNLDLLNQFRGLWAMGEGWWETILHCKRLYEHASRDAISFRSRTRDDYVDLESSIHDSGGRPPDNNGSEASDAGGQNDDEGVGSTTIAAAQSLQGLAAAFGQEVSEESAYEDQGLGLDLAVDWQTWPLWGDQPNVPYAIEGIPFDYNLDVI